MRVSHVSPRWAAPHSVGTPAGSHELHFLVTSSSSQFTPVRSSFEVHVRSFLMSPPFDDKFYVKQRYSVWDCFLTLVFPMHLASTQRLSHRILLFSLCAQTALGS